MPVAVAPAMTTSGGASVTRSRQRPAARTAPACSMRTVDRAADEVGGTGRGGRACCSRVRPVSRRGRQRPREPPRAVLVVVRARRRHAARRAPRRRGPSHARLRSRPIASWSASSCVQAAALVGRRDVVGEPRRGRAGPRRVGRREDLVVADRLEQPQRRLELRLGLAAEADDDVGRDRDARARPRGSARGARGSARSCTGGPSGAGPRRRPTGPAGGGARRPTAHSAMAAISRSERSHGCEVTKRRRGMAGRPSAVRRPSIARSSSARSGRPWRSRRRPAQRAVVDVREARLRRAGRGRTS